MKKGLYILESLDCKGYYHVIYIGEDKFGMNEGKQHIFNNSRITKFIEDRYCLDYEGGIIMRQQKWDTDVCFKQSKLFAISRLNDTNAKAAFYPVTIDQILQHYCKRTYIRRNKIRNFYGKI